MNDKAKLTPAQAQYVLEQLLANRKISYSDVNQALAGLRNEIDQVEAKLRSLGQAVGMPKSAPPVVAEKESPTAPPEIKPRRRARKISAERRASMKLQGQFLGLLHHFSKSERSKYTSLAKDKGRDAAIALMRKAAGKS